MSGIAENARRNSRRASSAAVSNNNFHVSGSNLKLERRKKTFTVNYLYPVHREKDTLINSFSTFFQGHEKEFFPNGAPIGLKEFQSMLDDVEFSSEGMSKSIMINLISLLLMNSGAQDYLKLTYQQTQFFVDSVACNYNEPAFHRFEHAFCVTQMVIQTRFT
ncbi:hypothetical protein HMI55_000803 [Coelomomyces lativittatus]|nr:hypothetical protein HMI55_000803 [Coelomomyces lativittatus]